MIDHGREITGLGGLETNGVKGVFFEGGQLQHRRGPVVLPFCQVYCLLVEVVKFGELFLVGLVVVFKFE